MFGGRRSTVSLDWSFTLNQLLEMRCDSIVAGEVTGAHRFSRQDRVFLRHKVVFIAASVVMATSIHVNGKCRMLSHAC